MAPQQQLTSSSISRTLQCVVQMLRTASQRPFQKVLQPPEECDEIWANRSVRKRDHRLLWRLDYFLRGKNDHIDFSLTQNCEKTQTSSQLSCCCLVTWLMILPLGLARVKCPQSHLGTPLMRDLRREKQKSLLLWAENTSNTAVFTVLLVTVSCLRKMDSQEYIAFPDP